MTLALDASASFPITMQHKHTTLTLKARLWFYSVNLVFAVFQLIFSIVGASVLVHAFNENTGELSALAS